MLPYALAVIAIFVNPKITENCWLQYLKSSRDHLVLGIFDSHLVIVSSSLTRCKRDPPLWFSLVIKLHNKVLWLKLFLEDIFV